jgi:hypothetical protein
MIQMLVRFTARLGSESLTLHQLDKNPSPALQLNCTGVTWLEHEEGDQWSSIHGNAPRNNMFLMEHKKLVTNTMGDLIKPPSSMSHRLHCV